MLAAADAVADRAVAPHDLGEQSRRVIEAGAIGLESKGPTEKLIAELGISDIVHISSGVTDDELAALLASAEIACIPSLYEGFSLPAVEAMASGTPIVASRAGALPEVLGSEGACAVLVTPGDVEELTKTLGDLLDSPEQRYRLGIAGRNRAVRGLQLGIRGGPDGQHLPTRYRSGQGMLTVDFDRLGVGPGTKMIDVGAGAGRHSFEAYRRGADIVAFDMDAAELDTVATMFEAMAEAGEAPATAHAQAVVGNALELPYPGRHLRRRHRLGDSRACAAG